MSDTCHQSLTNKGSLICFVGTDGSGKSTLALRAKHLLNNNGHRCLIVWGANDLLVLRPLVRLAKRVLIHEKSDLDYRSYKQKLEEKAKGTLLGRVYKALLLTEYWFELLAKVRIPLALGYTVISDRYIYDTAINIASNMGMHPEDTVHMVNSWVRYYQRPDLVIYVDVPPEVSVSRKDDIPHIDYVRERKRYYDYLVSHFGFNRVSGTLPLEDYDSYLMELFGMEQCKED